MTDLEKDEPCATQPGSWSPDGQHIVFYSDRAGSFDIYTMTSEGDSVRRLTTSDATDINPDWGP